ncbi:MAG: TonB family protein [Alphaproteobacteria bacterium]
MRSRRDRLTPAALIVSLTVHAAAAGVLFVEWGGSDKPLPFPTVVVELVDGPPGQRSTVQDRTPRNSGVAAQSEPQHEPPARATARIPDAHRPQPADNVPPPPDAQRPPTLQPETKPLPEPTPQFQATLPAPPPEPPKRAHVQPAAKPATKPAPVQPQIAARPTEPSTAASAAATPGDLTPPRFGIGAGQNPMPAYPDYARRRGWEGRVVLSVDVDEAGRSRSVVVRQTSGHPVLDEAALAAVRSWRFVPGMRGNTPVAAQVDVPIRFRLEDMR